MTRHRPKPTWLDWLAVIVTVALIYVIATSLTELRGPTISN